LFLGKITEKLIMACSRSEKIIAFPSLDVLRTFPDQEKGFNLTSAHFSPKNVKTLA